MNYMQPFHLRSAAEQVAEHLRAGLESGVWREEMPGETALAKELGVNPKTVQAALALLVREGVLGNQGERKPRRILAAHGIAKRSLRIGMLLGDAFDRQAEYIAEIHHRLTAGGHAPFFARKNLTDLGMDVGRVAAFVERTHADVWLVVAAPRKVIEWFAAGPRPVFGLFGSMKNLPIAGGGPQKLDAYAEVVRTLVAQGHKRIVLLARLSRREPVPVDHERVFLRTLGEAGIEVGDYHFPRWENTREGFQKCLEGLFRVNPPTALVVQETTLFSVVQQFLGARGIRVPHDVSLVCDDPDPTFEWRVPSVAHIRWDSEPWIRRACRWADNIARGKDDRRSVVSHSEFVNGGTIGPVPR
ncbi:substrate-binding domain-containing protein [Akkermansiaceae bacterium]|nr:substrate-binding domain-containing protein [Akkermansiaceae bacterium]